MRPQGVRLLLNMPDESSKYFAHANAFTEMQFIFFEDRSTIYPSFLSYYKSIKYILYKNKSGCGSVPLPP